MSVRPIRRTGRPGGAPSTPYTRWGGAAFFEALVDRFYRGVEADGRLRPMYPADLAESKAHLALFLGQYWGGPADYNARRGAPRLRMRHVPFAIGPPEAAAWMEHMTAAVRGSGLAAADQEELLEYLAMAARSLVNTVPSRRVAGSPGDAEDRPHRLLELGVVEPGPGPEHGGGVGADRDP